MSASPLITHFKMPPHRSIVVIGGCVFFLLLISVFGYFGRLSTSPTLIDPDFGAVEESIQDSSPSPPHHDLLDDILNATLGVGRLVLARNLGTDMAQFEQLLALNLPERTDHRDALILASALSDMHVDFIEGVHGDTISNKALPPGGHANLGPSHFGAWRAHMNAIST